MFCANPIVKRSATFLLFVWDKYLFFIFSYSLLKYSTPAVGVNFNSACCSALKISTLALELNSPALTLSSIALSLT